MSIYEKAKEYGLITENGVSSREQHHPESIKLMDFLAKHDFNDYGDYFDWRRGGEGDNGEVLMSQLDVYFDTLDKQKK